MRIPIFLLVMFSVAGVSATELLTLRTWPAPDRTRLVFDLSGPAPVEIFRVNGPDRVVIDLPQTTHTNAVPLVLSPDSRIRSLRYAARDQGLRIVLELTQPLVIRHALLPPTAPYGHRLVVDLLEPELPPEAPSVARVPAPAPAETQQTQPQPERPLVAAPAPSPPTVAVPAAAVIVAGAVATAAPKSSLPAWRRDGVVVVIDPGHGGDDVGAIGARGSHEKDVVLAVARELKVLIDRQPGMRAVLTRDGDYYLGLRERMTLARAKGADLFVSIHADAFRDRRVRGSSVFVLSRTGASSEAARWLAEQENAADFVGGLTLDGKDAQLKSVLLDLSQTASLAASMEVARSVLNALGQIGPLHYRRIQQAGFMVLKSPDIPSLLVETAYISNPEEEGRLGNRAFRQKLAGAIRDGIMRYFDEHGVTAERSAQAPGEAGHQHWVNPGETLSGIALHYAVSPERIRLANNLDTDTVRVGELLHIP